MLRIKDLSAPITAAKSDWLPGTSWLGFTPSNISGQAREQCRSTITSQINNGYIIEYITHSFGTPNSGHENDEEYITAREDHRHIAGKLIAVHRVRPSARPLAEILGEKAFNKLQDLWSSDGKRCRWSVAFPIVESFEIVGQPFASDVFSISAMKRLFAHPSATLRPLNNEEREQIAELSLIQILSLNSWIGIEDEIKMAEGSEIHPETIASMDDDLLYVAMEGMTEEQKAKTRRRAAWLADKFVLERDRNGRLYCDNCSFDPATKARGTGVRPRSLMDVHHKNPLDEGVRYTTLLDFQLLCPNCHRYEHALMRAKKTL